MSRAVVLQSFNLGESDLGVVFLCPEAGKRRGVARGGQSLKSPFAGSFFTLNVLETAYEACPGKEFVRLDSCRVIESAFPLFETLRQGQVMFSFLELMNAFAQEGMSGQDAAPLYRLVERWLAAARRRPDSGEALLCYAEGWLLKLEGLLPPLHVCGTCGKRILGSARWLSRSRVLACTRCDPSSKTGRSGSLSSAAVTLLRRRLFRLPPEAFSALKSNSSVLKEIKRFFRPFLEDALGSASKVPYAYRTNAAER